MMIFPVREHLAPLVQRVLFLARLGRFRAAEALVRQGRESSTAGEADVSLVDTLVGFTLHRQGRFREAVDAFRQAFRRNPQNDEALLSEALALVEVGAYDHARRLLGGLAPASQHTAGVGLGPDGATADGLAGSRARTLAAAWMHLARLLVDYNDNEHAEMAWRQVLRLTPGEHTARSALVRLYFQRGDTASAERELDRWALEDAASPDLALWRGIGRYRLGQQAAARQYFDEALRLQSRLAARFIEMCN